jgi:hypothetical protein
MTPVDIANIVASLCPGYWWTQYELDGHVRNGIKRIYFDSSWGLCVQGEGSLDEFIRTNDATFVKLVEGPPPSPTWTPDECTAVADALVAVEAQRPGSRQRFFDFLEARTDQVNEEELKVLSRKVFKDPEGYEAAILEMWRGYGFFKHDDGGGYTRTQSGYAFYRKVLADRKAA